MTNRLVIVGAGGHGVVVGDAAASTGDWTQIVFADDSYPGRQNFMEWQIIGKSTDRVELLASTDAVLVAIGDNASRMKQLNRFKSSGARLALVVHPDASVSQLATLGGGTVVMANAVINARTAIGDGCIINSGATVDHDCFLGSGVHVSPGANLAGNVKVGDRSWIGIGASVRNRIQIGEDCVVGAGAVVVKDVADGVTVVGNPAAPIGR